MAATECGLRFSPQATQRLTPPMRRALVRVVAEGEVQIGRHEWAIRSSDVVEVHHLPGYGWRAQDWIQTGSRPRDFITAGDVDHIDNVARVENFARRMGGMLEAAGRIKIMLGKGHAARVVTGEQLLAQLVGQIRTNGKPQEKEARTGVVYLESVLQRYAEAAGQRMNDEGVGYYQGIPLLDELAAGHAGAIRLFARFLLDSVEQCTIETFLPGSQAGWGQAKLAQGRAWVPAGDVAQYLGGRSQVRIEGVRIGDAQLILDAPLSVASLEQVLKGSQLGSAIVRFEDRQAIRTIMQVEGFGDVGLISSLALERACVDDYDHRLHSVNGLVQDARVVQVALEDSNCTKRLRIILEPYAERHTSSGLRVMYFDWEVLSFLLGRTEKPALHLLLTSEPVNIEVLPKEEPRA